MFLVRASAPLTARAGVALGLMLAAGCAPRVEPRLATEIVLASGATGDGFGDAARAVNGVRGAGDEAGSLDVYSLDYAERRSVTLGFGGRHVTNGPGADLIVFENAFRIAGATNAFMDLLVVSVSSDGETWVDFPHDYVAADELRYSWDPADWPGFAGRTPVRLNADSNATDPCDPAASGGDAFDLDDLDVEGAAGGIRAGGFRYVRLTTAPTLVNPDTGAPYPRDPIANGADIDGVVGCSFD